MEEMNGLFVAVCLWQIEELDYSLPTALSGLSRWVCAPKSVCLEANSFIIPSVCAKTCPNSRPWYNATPKASPKPRQHK